MYRTAKKNLPTGKRENSNNNKIYIASILKENMSGPLYLIDPSIRETLKKARESIDKAERLGVDLTKDYEKGSIAYGLQEALDLEANALNALVCFAVREDTTSLNDLEYEGRNTFLNILQVLKARAEIPGTIHYSPAHKKKTIEDMVFALRQREFHIPEEFRRHLPIVS